MGVGAGHHCNQTTLPLLGLAQVVIADPAEVLCVCWCAEGLVGTASLCRGFGSGHFPFNNIVCQMRARSWSKIFHHNMHPRPAPSPTDQHEEHFAPGSQCSRHAWRFGLPLVAVASRSGSLSGFGSDVDSWQQLWCLAEAQRTR